MNAAADISADFQTDALTLPTNETRGAHKSPSLPEKHLAVCLLSVVPAPELIRLAKISDDAGLDGFWLAGTPTQVTDRLPGLSALGLRWPLLYQVLGPDRATAIR